MSDFITVNVAELTEFVQNVFKYYDISEENSKIITDVLITADRRGILSHGVARLERYINGLKSGMMDPKAEPVTIKESNCSIAVNGNAGMGQVASYKTMQKVIEKAKTNNICMATVNNSNHYGIAGYYSMMALSHDLIGISLTNSLALVVPTFGKQVLTGTNPISVAVPVENEMPFVLDMATSTVPRGKIEVFNRLDKELPNGWAVSSSGEYSKDPVEVLDNIKNKSYGGLTPLGGIGELLGGHKGFGLSILVDILTGVLSGGSFGRDVYSNGKGPSEVCHFFAAINIEAFTEKDEFTNNMERLYKQIRHTKRVDNEDRIYIHGEKEYNRYNEQRNNVLIDNSTYEKLISISQAHHLEFCGGY